MILMVVALMLEAGPLAAGLELKKDPAVHAYPVYQGAGIRMAVSGVGKMKSAMAATFLLAGRPAAAQDILLNIGFCGANGSAHEPGSLLAVHKVTDLDTGRDYYPDVFWGRSLPAATLLCAARPVQDRLPPEYANCDLFVDMESAGIMEAAARFLDADQVALLKIISDDLQPQILDKTVLRQHMQRQMPQVRQIVDELRHLFPGGADPLPAPETAALDQLAGQIRLTVAMRRILDQDVRRAKTRGIDAARILSAALTGPVAGKPEGKRIFEQLRIQLRQ